MPKKPKYLIVGLDLSLHFELNLRAHQHKLVLDLVRLQVTPDLDELLLGLVDLPITDELARRVRHESRQADDENHPPRYLDAKGKTPLYGPVRRIATRHPHPVRHHGTEADPTS